MDEAIKRIVVGEILTTYNRHLLSAENYNSDCTINVYVTRVHCTLYKYDVIMYNHSWTRAGCSHWSVWVTKFFMLGGSGSVTKMQFMRKKTDSLSIVIIPNDKKL